MVANLRRRAARRAIEYLSSAVEERIPAREPDPAFAGEFEQVRQWVRCALGELRSQVSEAGYQVVFLRWIEGKRIAEIAAALGLTPKQVRDQHRRTIIKLRLLLAKRVN